MPKGLASFASWASCGAISPYIDAMLPSNANAVRNAPKTLTRTFIAAQRPVKLLPASGGWLSRKTPLSLGVNAWSGLPRSPHRAGRGRLSFHAIQSRIQACPIRCAGYPDIHARLDRRGIIQIADTHPSELRRRTGSGKKMSAAIRAKLPRDFIAAVRHLDVFGKRAGEAECRGRNQHVHRSVRGKMLAVPAPANANDGRVGGNFKSDCAT
jgi:hypothetical protein